MTIDRTDADWLAAQIDTLPYADITMTVDQHCRKRMMPKPLPGYYDPAVTPYMIDIMRDMSPQSPVRKVALLKSAQVGATTACENVLLFYLDHAPGSVALYITANDDVAAEWSEKRLDPALDSIGLIEKIAPIVQTGRKTGDKRLSKSFLNGSRCRFTSYNRAASLRMDSVQIVLMDELDAAPATVGKEGDPMELAEARTIAYSGRSKIFLFSTPLEKSTSKIYPAFLKGDQRLYNIPCPECGHMQPLVWRDRDIYRLRYETDARGFVIPESVGYMCANCGALFTDKNKMQMLQSGRWVPTNPDAPKNYHSYSINALYSPFLSWESIAQEWADAMNDMSKLQGFMNLKLGEPYEERGFEAPRLERVTELRSDYKRGTVPDSVMVATLGIDVQKGGKKEPARLECELCGFSEEGNAYSIDYYVIEGDTDDPNAGAWAELRRKITGQDFPFVPSIACIDSSFRPEVTNKFCESLLHLHPVQGAETMRGLFKEYRLKEFSGLLKYDINTLAYKDILYQRLALRRSVDGIEPPNMLYFPSDYPMAYFDQLTAEEKRAKKVHGKIVGYQYTTIRDRNEALDCRVYCMAGLDILALQVSVLAGKKEIDWPIFWDWCRSGRV